LIASFQASVVGDLTRRTLAAVDAAAASGVPAQSIFVTGGVAANRALRRNLEVEAERQGLRLYAPAPGLCTDNAAMIATAAFSHFHVGQWADTSLSAFAQLALDQPVP